MHTGTPFSQWTINLIRKSCTNDPIPSSLVRDHSDILVPAITYIVNLSLQTALFCLKSAVINRCIRKKSLDLVPSNNRPVSNLAYLSKIIEKSVACVFNSHMENEDFLPTFFKVHTGFATALIPYCFDCTMTSFIIWKASV